MNNKNNYKTVKIFKVIKEVPKVKIFVLETKLTALPGQYLMVWVPGVNEKPFAVVNSSPLTLLINKIGPTTEIIHQLKKGDKITYRGPYGTSFKLKNGKILLVGGGYGVAPLYFLAKKAKENKNEIKVIIGAKTKKDLCLVKDFKKITSQVFVSTDDGSSGFKGYASQLAKEILEKEEFAGVYTCGPILMMTRVVQLAKKKDIFCQVSLESFFKCGGYGLCGECSFKGRLVCREGPVFEGKILL